MPDSQPKSLTVESSKAIAQPKTIDIQGLEEIPSSMIPIPFYKVVQPGSTNITLSSGEDAQPGTFFMADSGQATVKLRFALLRAKRQHREFTDEGGEVRRLTNLGILGMNLEGFKPFILGVSLASFSNFGRLMAQLKEKKAKTAWEYAIVATAEKREESKVIANRLQKVKYWVVNFQLEEKPVEKEAKALLEDAFVEFAANLDRVKEDEATEPSDPEFLKEDPPTPNG